MSAMPCPAGVIHTPRRSTAWRRRVSSKSWQVRPVVSCAVGGRWDCVADRDEFEFFAAGVGDRGEQVVDHDGFGLVDAPVVECGPSSSGHSPDGGVHPAVGAAQEIASMVASSSAAPLSE